MASGVGSVAGHRSFLSRFFHPSVSCRTSAFFLSDVLRLFLFYILLLLLLLRLRLLLRLLVCCSFVVETEPFFSLRLFFPIFSFIIKLLLPFLWATEKRTLYDKATAAVVEHRYGRCCLNEDVDEHKNHIFSFFLQPLSSLSLRSPLSLSVFLAWSTLRLPRKSSSWNTNKIMWLEYGVTITPTRLPIHLPITDHLCKLSGKLSLLSLSLSFDWLLRERQWRKDKSFFFFFFFFYIPVFAHHPVSA